MSHGRATGPSSCCPRGEDPDLLLPATRMGFPGHLGRTCRGDVRGVSDTALAEPRPSAARWRRECQPGAGLSSGRAACPRLPARRPDRGLRAPHRHRPTPRSSLPRLSSCAKARPPARPEAAARGHPGPSGSSRGVAAGGGRCRLRPVPVALGVSLDSSFSDVALVSAAAQKPDPVGPAPEKKDGRLQPPLTRSARLPTAFLPGPRPAPPAQPASPVGAAAGPAPCSRSSAPGIGPLAWAAGPPVCAVGGSWQPWRCPPHARTPRPSPGNFVITFQLTGTF